MEPETIIAAVQQLVAQGKTPSARLVQAITGGSMRDVTALLREVKGMETTPAAVEAGAAAGPAAPVEAVSVEDIDARLTDLRARVATLEDARQALEQALAEALFQGDTAQTQTVRTQLATLATVQQDQQLLSARLSAERSRAEQRETQARLDTVLAEHAQLHACQAADVADLTGGWEAWRAQLAVYRDLAQARWDQAAELAQAAARLQAQLAVALAPRRVEHPPLPPLPLPGFDARSPEEAEQWRRRDQNRMHEANQRLANRPPQELAVEQAVQLLGKWHRLSNVPVPTHPLYSSARTAVRAEVQQLAPEIRAAAAPEALRRLLASGDLKEGEVPVWETPALASGAPEGRPHA
jgi:DNA repair exonuclease SbcCD ATPase subunit